MIYVALVTLLILAQYSFFFMQAGMARGKGEVKAPAVSGDELFERANRVQTNSLEQMVITLPAMWVCAHYFRADIAAILGFTYFVGRFLYSFSYMKEPSKRAMGFMIGFLANTALLLCGFWGVISTLL